MPNIDNVLNNNRLKLNTIFSLFSLLINIIVALFYTPFLVSELGIAAYGIIPLALLINQYIGVLTDSLTASFTRFYVISIQNKKWNDASSYLSTSLFVVVLIILLSIYPSILFLNNLNIVFNIPERYYSSAEFLFLFTLLSFFLSLISSFFNIILLAYNRVDLLSIIKVIRGVLKPIFVIIFFYFQRDILFVGLSNFIGEIIILFLSIYFFQRFSSDNVLLNPKYISRVTFYSMISMSFWVIIQNIGDIGLFRLDSFVVNRLWSTIESGVIGALGELGSYINIVGFTLINIVAPMILISYSKDDIQKVKELTLDSSLNIGLLFAVLIGVLIGFSDIFIELWFKNQSIKGSSIWLTIKFSIIPFYLAAGFFVSANRAKNVVKKPALWTMLLGFLNVIILLLCIHFYPNFSVNGVLLSCLFFGVFQCYFLNGYYFIINYKDVTKIILVNFVKILVTLLVISILSYYININVLQDLNIYLLLLIIFVYTLFFLLITFFILAKKDQRLSIIKIITKK